MRISATKSRYKLVSRRLRAMGILPSTSAKIPNIHEGFRGMACVLVIGGGAREHAVCVSLAKSAQVATIYVCPGNAGTHVELKCRNIALDIKNHADVVSFCHKENVNLVFVGPEDPLADGLIDSLEQCKICCFGPSKAAAQIESSKAFAKEFMKRHGFPTAPFACFTNPVEAYKYVQSNPKARVVKVSGLAAGKGVVVSKSVDEARQAVRSALEQNSFGEAGRKIVVEDILTGVEVSALCFTDGVTVRLMPLAQDNKRLLDGDEGPNTGGMGAVCPFLVDFDILREIQNLLEKTVAALREEGIVYKGLMLTDEGIQILEFNSRFGDPETQVILPLLKTDLYHVMLAGAEGRLSQCDLVWNEGHFAVGVVIASQGYPFQYSKGHVIQGLEVLDSSYTTNIKVFHAGTAMSDSAQVLTTGGRVLCVVAVGHNAEEVARQATCACDLISFPGAFHRSDIRFKPLGISKKSALSYESAGVCMEAGDRLVGSIEPLCRATSRPGARVELGGFGGLFDLRLAGYKNPVLVSGTDGVGTKLKIAIDCNRHDTIGLDLVAMCVNDILVHGAEPLFFLDYFATGRLSVNVAHAVIAGVAKGCAEAKCALIGGETAEMPGLYGGDDYDIAGFAVGALEKDEHPMLPMTDRMQVGDILIGLPSSGVHSNGFSFVRKILEAKHFDLKSTCPWNANKTLGESLLTPTRIYVGVLLPILRSGLVLGAAHITGGGLIENVPRVLPKHLAAVFDAKTWPILDEFRWLSACAGNRSDAELHEFARVFNCGIGMVLVTAAANAEAVMQALKHSGESCYRIGQLLERDSAESAVKIVNMQEAFSQADHGIGNRSLTIQNGVHHIVSKKRVAVLISGSGSNLQALIDHSRAQPNCTWDMVLVISNVPGVHGLERARIAGISTKIVDSKAFATRAEFDAAVEAALVHARVDVVCLAGFMRILTADFCKRWHGRLVNIHPSLLPAFKGAHAIRDALNAGVRITGCTVHFVAPEVDAGAIILQEAVQVMRDDDERSLLERIHKAEHRTYSNAVDLISSGCIALDADGKILEA